MVNATEQAVSIKDEVRAPATERNGSGRRDFKAPAAIFVSSLVVLLWYNFVAVHANTAGCADASEYIRLASGIGDAVRLVGQYPAQFAQCAFGTADSATVESVRTMLLPLREMHQSGPIFPLALACGNALFGGFQQSVADAGVLLQCILGAFTCLLIYDFTSRAWDKRVGLIAAGIAAVYPGFIVNSGRLYSESFATFLACALLSLVVRVLTSVKPGTSKTPANTEVSDLRAASASPEHPHAPRKRMTAFAKAQRLLQDPLVMLAFGIGVTACALQLTRSILVLFTIALVPVLIWQSKKKWLPTLLAFGLGCIVVTAPWIIMQNVAFGKSSLMVDRVGSYNLFIGTNTATQGWLTFPYPDGRDVEKDSLTNLLLKSATTNPSKFIGLMLDKPARLWQMPWNDFRTSIGIFSIAQQSAFHQLILLLAGIGLCLAVATEQGALMRHSQVRARLMLISFCALHFLYALFITVPRYGLTAMPLVIAFAAAGAAILLRFACAQKQRAAAYLLVSYVILCPLLRCNLIGWLLDSTPLSPFAAYVLSDVIKLAFVVNAGFATWLCIGLLNGYARIARMITVLTFLTLTPLMLLPIRAEGRWNEWRQPVIVTQPVQQTVNLPQNLDWRTAPLSYLIVDADNASMLTNAQVSINGKPLTAPVIPGMALTQNWSQLRHITDESKAYWEGEYIFDCMAQPADTSNAQLRQWYCLPIPAKILSTTDHTLHVKITPAPSANGSLYGSYPVKPNALNLPSPGTYSWEKTFYGVENNDGLTDPRLDEKFPVSTTARKEPNIRLLVPASDPATITQKGIKPSAVKPSQLQQVASFSIPSLKVETSHPQDSFVMRDFGKFPAYSIWAMRIRGSVRTTMGNADPNIRLQAHSSYKTRKFVYDSPWTLRTLPGNRDWQPFEMTVPISPGRLPGHLDNIAVQMNLHTPQWKTRHVDTEGGASEIHGLDVDIVQLPRNPLTRYELY